MELDDVATTESAVVAAATATVLSPRVRGALRRGAVYGVAGVLKAGDVVAGAARGAVHGMRDADGTTSAGGGEAGETAEPATPRPTPATRPARRRAGAGS